MFDNNTVTHNDQYIILYMCDTATGLINVGNRQCTLSYLELCSSFWLGCILCQSIINGEYITLYMCDAETGLIKYGQPSLLQYI